MQEVALTRRHRRMAPPMIVHTPRTTTLLAGASPYYTTGSCLRR